MLTADSWCFAQSLQHPDACIADVMDRPVFDPDRCTFTLSQRNEQWLATPKADWDYLDIAMKGLLYKYFKLIPAPAPLEYEEQVEH